MDIQSKTKAPNLWELAEVQWYRHMLQVNLWLAKGKKGKTEKRCRHLDRLLSMQLDD